MKLTFSWINTTWGECDRKREAEALYTHGFLNAGDPDVPRLKKVFETARGDMSKYNPAYQEWLRRSEAGRKALCPIMMESESKQASFAPRFLEV